MLIVLILLILLILLLAHLFILPISQRRPIFIKGFEGTFFFAVSIAVLAAITHPLIYISAIAVPAFIYYTNSWIIYGVARDDIMIALDKALLATRATGVRTNYNYKIDNTMLIKINSLGLRLCYIQYKTYSYSKKSELTKETFRKFIQNYFI